MKMNKLMKEAFDKIDLSNLKMLPDSLTSIINEGFIENEKGLFFRKFYLKSRVTNLDQIPDKTGCECFVNKIHIDDYSKTISESFEIAVSFSLRLLETISRPLIRTIISFDDVSCVFRFHVIRADETWLSDNLELYLEDGILVIDSEDLPILKWKTTSQIGQLLSPNTT